MTDHDTVSVKFSSFTYQNAKGNDVTGSLTSLQLADIAKVEAAVTVSGNTGPNTGGFGSATWNYSVTDKAFDFLAAGETLTLTYTATVDNNYQPLDQTGSQTITITITGTNDAPVITSPQQNVSFVSSGTDTKGGELIPNTATQGTLNFTDPDLTDTHTVAVQMASALLNGQPLANTAGQSVINELTAALTASISSNGGQDSTGTGAGTIEWTLANLQVYLADLVPNGESLVLTYAVTVTDSQGATSVQDIVVTIGGNNEAAVVWTNTNPIPPGGVAQWSDAANWEGDRAPSTQGTDDVFIGTDQLQPGTPVFPATVTDAEAAKSLTMDYFTDFGTSIPELDILSTGKLTIAGALKMDTSTDAGSPLTAESIIKNFGTLSVGGIAELLKHSVLDNYGTVTLAQGGVFGDQSSITNSGTIEVVSDTLDVQVDIANFVTTTGDDSPVTTPGTIQVDGGATLKLSDGATITKGEVTLGSLSVLDVEMGAVSLPAGTPDATLDGVSVIGTSGLTPSTIQIGTSGAATLLLDDGTSIENGNLTISGGSALDVTTSGATLDGVTLTGTNATLSVAASTIEVGTTTTAGTVLTLDDGTTITNGNLIIDAGNTLDIESAGGATLDGVNVTNSGTIQVDSQLVLDGVTINGGTVDDIGTLSVSASSEIENATVNGGGDLTVTGGTLTLSEVTLDNVTLAGSFTNSDKLTIKDTVTLNGATVNGGTIDDTGTLSVSTASTIENAIVNGGGNLTATSAVLTFSGVTLDDVTLTGLFTNSDKLTIDDTVTLDGFIISGGTIDDTGTLSVTSGVIEGTTVDGGGNLTSTGAGASLAGVTLDDVTLSGSFMNASTVKIDDTVTLDGATINGSTIDDTGTLSVSTASTIENATVDGGGNLTATSATLTLSGVLLENLTLAGSFTNSNTLVTEGTVTLNGATISGGEIEDPGTLSVSASSEIENATVDGGGDLTVTSGTLTLSKVTLDGVTLAGSFTNSDTLTIDDMVTLNGATINGGTINDIGTLSVTASSEIENATVNGGGDLTVTGGTLTLSKVTLDGVTLAGSFTNSDTLTIDATVTLNGATINGGTVDDIGTLSVSASSEIENATVNGGGDLTVTGGTLTLSEVTLDNVTLAGSFTNSDKLTIKDTVTLNGATVDGGTIDDTGTITGYGVISSVIAGLGVLTASGGTLTLSGLNTYSGVTTIDSGAVLAAGVADAFSASSAVTDNGELDLGTTDQTIAALNGTNTAALVGSFSGTGTGPAVLTINNGGSFAGVVEDGSAGAATALTLAGGTLTLTGDNLYTGVTTISGTLVLSGSGSIAGSSDVVDDGTFDISATTSGASIVTLSGDGTVALGIETLTLTNASSTFSGAIDGSGGLTLTAGTETLTGDNLYTGATTINGGTLVLSGLGSIAGSSDVVDDGTLDISATTSGASVVTLSGNGTVALGGKKLTLTNASTTFSGTIGGTGGLALLAGMLTLTGDSSYSGTTTISGTLALSGSGSIADSSDVIDNGTFDIMATSSGASIVTLSGNGTIKLGAETLTLSDASTTFSGTIGGTGGLTLTAGTETLTGDNLYTGTTTINGGTLALSGTGSIAGSSDVIDNGTFDISATTSGASIVTLSGNGTIKLGAETLTLSDASTTFSGTISGTGGLTLTAGAETLTGNNTYSGVTTINGGTLALKGSGSIAHSSDVIDDGTFDISATTSGASIVTLSGNGAVTLGAETLTLSNASTTFSGTVSSTGGGITVASGTLTLGTMTLDDLTLAGNFSNSGTLTIDDTVTLNGATISGGTLDISGILDSTGTDLISGATIINPDHIDIISGTLTIDPTPVTNTGTIEVHADAALVLSGEVVTNSHGVTSVIQEVVTNTNGVIQIDPHATLTLFDTTINGGTIIDNGTLLLTGTTSKLENVTFSGTASIDISSHATLEIGGSVSSGVTVKFDVSNGHSGLILENPSDFHGVVEGLVEASSEADENYIDLEGFADTTQTKVSSAVFNSATDVTAVTITNGTKNLTIDLHGDYSKGDIEFATDHNGGTLFSDPAANSGAVTVDSGTTLDIGAASTATITFANSTGTTGELVLADSKDFSGTIVGFTGDGTTANSDLIDATDVNIADVAISKTTYTENAAGTGGTLTLHDANGQVLDSVNFDGNYQLANFTIESDGDGGTLIVDPPVNTSGQAPGGTTVASNEHSTDKDGTDGFVFNFAGHNHAPTTDFHPDLENLQPGGSMLTNLHTGSNVPPDQGTPAGGDGHDHIGLSPFAKAHLHAADFHFV